MICDELRSTCNLSSEKNYDNRMAVDHLPLPCPVSTLRQPQTRPNDSFPSSMIIPKFEFLQRVRFWVGRGVPKKRTLLLHL